MEGRWLNYSLEKDRITTPKVIRSHKIDRPSTVTLFARWDKG